jgi:hypothetical protein
MRGSHCEPLALNQSRGMACDYITRLSSLADATSVGVVPVAKGGGRSRNSQLNKSPAKVLLHALR